MAAPGTGVPGATADAPAAPPTDAIYVAQPPLPPLEPRSRHYHDGFYLRLSVGFGGLGVSSNGGGTSSTTSGWGGAIDVLAGGTPAPGLVVGGGVLLQEAFSPSFSERGHSGPVGLGMLGPMIDAFPNPAGGFHVGGLVGLSRVGLDDAHGNASGGLGLSVWAGYMWWASSQWSLGGLVRLSAARSGRTLGADPAQYDVADTTRAATFMVSTAFH
ncbi:MAG TPA: hypothetical protein VF395_22305 [Polyangiaceae bacterium]